MKKKSTNEVGTKNPKLQDSQVAQAVGGHAARDKKMADHYRKIDDPVTANAYDIEANRKDNAAEEMERWGNETGARQYRESTGK